MGWAQPHKPSPEQLQRRAGRADAAVLLVAKRINPTMDIHDWGKLLELDHVDLVAAVDRFKARARPRPPLALVVPVKKLDAAARNARDRDIIRRRAAGETWQAIATHYSLTTERIRQIVRLQH